MSTKEHRKKQQRLTALANGLPADYYIQREKAIVAAFDDPMTEGNRSYIARRFDLSPQRIRQILVRNGKLDGKV